MFTTAPRSIKRLAACLLLATSAGLAQAATSVGGFEDPGIEIRAKLFRERFLKQFMLGTTAPIEWFNETRTQNGATWDFRQAYFSGGAGWDGKRGSWDTVFLHNWNKWVNPDKKKGVWAEKFIKPSVEANYIPWITFYNLAQSHPADYKPGPAKATPTNMKVAATMKAYWDQVQLVLTLCDKYKPHPIVLHVEPDEWGHMLLDKRDGKTLNAASIDVKVGGSGHPDLSGLPDNLIGYTQAWLKLRAKYAPTNVILAANPSAWDWRGSMSADNWVRIFKDCKAFGPGGFEIAVLEFGDRDVGASGKNPPYTAKDVVTRFESWENMTGWINTLHKGTGMWVCMWQVAVGNTYFRTCNQTDKHYCDGIAQGLLEGYPQNPMVGKFATSGCLGFVFSPGQGHQTHVHDAAKDGITNPEPIAGNLGHESKYADDDGGYMRLRAGDYYKNPFKMMGAPGPAGTATVNASPSGGTPAAAAVAKPAPPPQPTVDAAKVNAYDAKLRAKLTAVLKAGKKVDTYLRLFGEKDQAKKYRVKTVGEKDLHVLVQGNAMPVQWSNLSMKERATLAAAVQTAAGDDDAEALLLAAIYRAGEGALDKAHELFAKASMKNAEAVTAAKADLGLSE